MILAGCGTPVNVNGTRRSRNRALLERRRSPSLEGFDERRRSASTNGQDWSGSALATRRRAGRSMSPRCPLTPLGSSSTPAELPPPCRHCAGGAGAAATPQDESGQPRAEQHQRGDLWRADLTAPRIPRIVELDDSSVGQPVRTLVRHVVPRASRGEAAVHVHVVLFVP